MVSVQISATNAFLSNLGEQFAHAIIPRLEMQLSAEDFV